MKRAVANINYRPLVLFAIGLCVGIVCSGKYNFPIACIAAALFVLAASIFFKYKPGIIVSIAMLCGFFRILFAIPDYKYFSGNSHAIHGTICKIYKEQAVIDEITVDNVKVSGRMLIAEKSDLRVGDRIACMAVISTAEKSYSQNYLLAQGIIYTTDDVESLIKTGEHHTLHSRIYSLHYYLHERIDEMFGDGADIVNAVLLGDTESIDGENLATLRTAGIAHILALSGLHVAILAKTIEFVFFFLHKKIKYLISMSFLMIYTAIVGFPVSFVRAVIMLMLKCIAFFTCRRYDPLTALAFAAAVCALFNPFVVFTASFVLSFGAVMSILLISRPVVQFLVSGEKSRFLHGAAQSVAASIGIMPVTAMVFGHISLYSIPVNIVCVPIATVAAAFAFAGMLAGLIFVPLAVPFAFVTNMLFKVVQDASTIAAMLPLAELPVQYVGALAVIMFYACEFFVSDYFIAKKKLKTISAVIALICFVFFVILGA